MSLKGPCSIAWFWVEFSKHLSQYYTASWSRCAHLAMCTYIVIIYIIVRGTHVHTILYTLYLIYNDALLLLIIAQSVNYSQVHHDWL